MIFVGILASIITAVYELFTQQRGIVWVPYGIVNPLLLLLPRFIHYANPKVRRRLSMDQVKRFELLGTIIIAFNIPGSLFLHEMGIQYDRVLHFLMGLFLVFAAAIIFSMFYEKPDTSRRKIIVRSGVAVFFGLFAFELWQFMADNIFGSNLFFDKAQKIEVDVLEDLLFGTIGLAIGLFALSLGKKEAKTDILIIGAGAAGLMAARELSKAGRKVTILEARNRTGGRIWPLPKDDFGYPAQGGAEFVHGPAPVTKTLIKEAGLTYVTTEGEIWDVRDGELTRIQDFLPHHNSLHEKLRELKEDLPISEFLSKYFGEEQYAPLRASIMRMVEGYDAADSNMISTFSLREEWLGGEKWQQGKIKEGYGALLDFLGSECRKSGVDIHLKKQVETVEMLEDGVCLKCVDGKEFKCQKVVITLSVPTLSSLQFNPAIPEKLNAASRIGFGNVIKILLLFKDRWWTNTTEKDLSNLAFLFSNEKVANWWTQYPESHPLLTGWLAGPTSRKFKGAPDEDILELAFASLSNIFKTDKDVLRNNLVNSKIVNWPADPLAQGAYSYSTVESKEAYAEMIKPVDNKIFFAGEALCLGKESATVEGALASAVETVDRVLNSQ